MSELKASKLFDIRFSEVDSMKVVWHGSYVTYFEDAREAFGAKYGLDYVNYHYHKSLRYGSKPRIDIVYRPTRAAKVVFDYAIYDTANGDLIATGHTVQAFVDTGYQLMLYSPDFYVDWQEKWKVFDQ